MGSPRPRDPGNGSRDMVGVGPFTPFIGSGLISRGGSCRGDPRRDLPSSPPPPPPPGAAAPVPADSKAFASGSAPAAAAKGAAAAGKPGAALPLPQPVQVSEEPPAGTFPPRRPREIRQTAQPRLLPATEGRRRGSDAVGARPRPSRWGRARSERLSVVVSPPQTKAGVISSVPGLGLAKGPLQIQVVGKGLPQLVPSVPVQGQPLVSRAGPPAPSAEPRPALRQGPRCCSCAPAPSGEGGSPRKGGDPPKKGRESPEKGGGNPPQEGRESPEKGGNPQKKRLRLPQTSTRKRLNPPQTG